ncbi:MAG: 2'-5' RNA ligase family protein [Chitinophagaceae bacterium]
MYKSDNRNREERYNGRPQYDRRNDRPAPLPEGVALYYIGTVCPVDVNEKVVGYKQYMQEKFGSRAAQKSPAHLTLVPPFRAEEDMESRLLDFIEAFNIGIVPFDIELNGFDHFGNKVLFVQVAGNESLKALEMEINHQFVTSFPAITFRSKPDFHPHVTIATRDIPEHRFEEAWNYIKQQEFNAIYACKELKVMKLANGFWKEI